MKVDKLDLKVGRADTFALRDDVDVAAAQDVHVNGNGVVCVTDSLGNKTPNGASPLKIVLDATAGFIPLWAPGTTLYWRFNEVSLRRYQQPQAVKAEIESMLGEALLAWGNAAPVKFTQRADAWDFEIVVRKGDDCDVSGCTLASAFFPDAGRHQLVIYPKMFEQDPREQVETLAHEVGHIFGLRHFFARVSETAWPAEVFGTHNKFSIMNYGADSRMSNNDRADLRSLYQQVWSGKLTQINGTPIRLVKPYHSSGMKLDAAIAARRLGLAAQPASDVYRDADLATLIP